MDWQEFELHSARRQLIKATAHLMDARKALIKTIDHNPSYASSNPTTFSIENNIHALIAGVNETIKFCAIAADEFKKQMKEPDAKPPPIKGGWGKQLTPFQRQLSLKGIKFPSMMPFVPTKTDKRIKRVLSFRYIPTKRKPKERITPDNPPIC